MMNEMLSHKKKHTHLRASMMQAVLSKPSLALFYADACDFNSSVSHAVAFQIHEICSDRVQRVEEKN
jgi:hypothetical protein